jgi:hypothetical protein
MKKKFLATAMVAVVAAIAGYNVYQVQNEVQLSDVQLADVEALAADGENGGTGNTGPSETVDCAGWFTGSKQVCTCRNPYPCTPQGCS